MYPKSNNNITEQLTTDFLYVLLKRKNVINERAQFNTKKQKISVQYKTTLYRRAEYLNYEDLHNELIRVDFLDVRASERMQVNKDLLLENVR